MQTGSASVLGTYAVHRHLWDQIRVDVDSITGITVTGTGAAGVDVVFKNIVDTSFTAGRIGFGTWYNQAFVDDVVVTRR